MVLAVHRRFAAHMLANFQAMSDAEISELSESDATQKLVTDRDALYGKKVEPEDLLVEAFRSRSDERIRGLSEDEAKQMLRLIRDALQAKKIAYDTKEPALATRSSVR